MDNIKDRYTFVTDNENPWTCIGVKGGKYDAMDITRGIETGQLNRTHEGERPFMKMLWRKVRDGFRRYSKDKKLRK